MGKVKVSASILSADFARLGEQVKAIDEAGADYIHMDVMDGRFVPNLTFGPKLIKDVRDYSDKPFDVHLMIENPEQYLEDYAIAGANIISVQYEAVRHLDRTITAINKLNRMAGLVLNPTTSEGVLEYIIEKLDLILIMTVNPGFGGQEFLSGQLKKIEKIRKMIDKSGKNIELEVDGGIKGTNVRQVVNAGADVVVSGSYIFDSGDYKKAIDSLR